MVGPPGKPKVGLLRHVSLLHRGKLHEHFLCVMRRLPITDTRRAQQFCLSFCTVETWSAFAHNHELSLSLLNRLTERTVLTLDCSWCPQEKEEKKHAEAVQSSLRGH